MGPLWQHGFGADRAVQAGVHGRLLLSVPGDGGGGARVIRPLNRAAGPVKSRPAKRGQTLKTKRTLTDGQRAYEARRAARAGVSLDKWLETKQRQQEAEARAKQRAAEPARPAKKPGLLSRLIERAQRPFGS